MNDFSPIYKHIPLSEDHNNWWYVGRKQILKHIIMKQKFTKELSILEIGPGVGVNIQILQDFGCVDILEVDEYFIDVISRNSKLEVNAIYTSLSQITKKYDLVVFMDVLEHIEHYDKFLDDVANIMTSSSLGILSVPAYQSLFSKHDENLMHFRRYNWKLIKDQFRTKFTILNGYGYNYFLLPIRYLQVKFLKSPVSDTTINPTVNFILKLFVYLEVFILKLNINPKFGLSLFAEFRKD
tara:strand:+ start:48 stop:764 length:717 start_codon:yes stop_codon:yes gene_type:complete